MPGPVRSLLALSLAACLLAGCGGGGVKEANKYVDAVNGAQNRFATTIDSLSMRISSTSTPAEDRATLVKYQAAVDRVVADLQRISPPEEVRDLHAGLITAMRDFGAAVRKASSDITSGSASRALAAPQDLAKAVADVSQKINTTIAAINRRLSD